GGYEVHERQGSRPEERHPRPELAQKAADDRADREADAEGDADQSEILGPVLVIADVGNIGRARCKASAADASKHPPQEKHPVARCDGADQVVDRKRQDGKQQDRPAPEAVAEIAQKRREQDLHSRIDQQQPAAIDGGVADAVTREFLEKGRQYRHDNRNPDDIEKEDHEDEEEPPPDKFGIEHGTSLFSEFSPERRSCRRETYIFDGEKETIREHSMFLIMRTNLLMNANLPARTPNGTTACTS